MELSARAARVAGAGAAMTSGGMLVAGRLIPVEGLNILPPASRGGPAWCQLSPGDYKARKLRCRQVVVHSTKGGEPQHVVPGAGPGGRAEHTFEFWFRDPTHSAAQIVIDNDGTVACGADLADVCAYHATVSNEYSVGIEMYQEADNGIYEAVYRTMAILAPAICAALDFPFSVVADAYNGHPLPRFLYGAPDFYGVLGHRDNTEQRGRGDPGDEIYRRLIAADGEPVLASYRQDVTLARRRQLALNQIDAKAGSILRPLVVDGEPGPASMATMRRLGFARWRDVPVG